MIRINRKEFELVVKERGYTLPEVEPCILSKHGNTFQVDETHKSYPREKKGLGDMVAGTLAAVGITEERYKKATGKKECGCKRRRQMLNKLGRKFGVG